MGDSKNINFDSNIDLSVQFAKRSYDTQRYNIKKLVNERLGDTIVFNTSLVEEKLREMKQSVEVLNEDFEDIMLEYELIDDIVENENNTTMLVTSVEKNEAFDSEGIEENERLEEQTAVIQRELERILKNSTQIVINEIEEENNKENAKSDSTDKGEVFKLERTKDKDNRLDLDEEKRRRAQEFFRFDDDEIIESKKSNSDFKKKANRFLFHFLIIALIALIAYIGYSFYVDSVDDEKLESNVDGELSIEEKPQETEGDVVEFVPNNDIDTVSPVNSSMSGYYEYEAIVAITSHNTSNPVVAITNDEFVYNKRSNESDYFKDFVYANIKNATPERRNDKLIVVFGKDDSEHFGSLKYLGDIDYFNTIEVNYVTNHTSSTYKALSYYKAKTLDSRLYDILTDVDTVKLIDDELTKSIHLAQDSSITWSDMEVLTLITYDTDNDDYHVLHLNKVK